MGLSIFPIGDVPASTIEGVSDNWVRLPQGAQPISYLYTGLPATVYEGRGVVMSSLKVFQTLLLDDCGTLWADIVGANTTQNTDLVDFKVGISSQRIDYAAAAAAGIINAGVISPGAALLPSYTHLEFWCKCSVATAAGDFQILLDDTAKCASPLETLNVPALTAGVWRHCRAKLANPQLDLTIISLGVKYTVDVGACSFWIDDVRAVTIARQFEVVQVHTYIPNSEYFSLLLPIQQDECRTDRELMVYYLTESESPVVTT
jgi:hypothetical protein